MKIVPVVLSCAFAAGFAAAAVPPAVPEARALLLMLADERRFEPSALESLAGHPDAGVRASVARTAGGLANPGSVKLLQRLAKDPIATVRAAAAEGSGRFAGDVGPDSKLGRKAGALLRKLLNDDSPKVRRAAAWAVAAAGSADAQTRLLGRLRSERDVGVRAACLAELWRGGAGEWVEAATAALADPAPEVREAAAWSLARAAADLPPGGVLAAVSSSDPAVRALGLDGARRSGAEELWPAALAGLEDANARVRIAALGALAAMLEKRPEESLPSAAAARVAAVAGSGDPAGGHERVMAIRLAGHAGVAASELHSAVAAADQWPAEEALVALVRQRAPGASELAREWLGAAEPWRRAAAVTALALVPEGADVLPQAAGDESPAVRLALVDALATNPGEPPAGVLRGLLTDSDGMVRAAALAALAERKALPDTATLLTLLGRERGTDARVALVDAIAAGEKPGEKETTALLRLLWGEDPVVARAAWAALRAHGQLRPLPLVRTGSDAASYAAVVEWASRKRFLEVVTVRGTVVVALDVDEAPLSAYSLSKLAEEGFFDGLTFHRVVPNFVAQGGDPRGDGWGGPPFTLRHELCLTPYGAGVVGLAHSGPDTAGSQFFITVTPQPHLTGRYPVVGRVTAGLDVAARLRRGDRIVRVRASEEAPPYFPVFYGVIDPDRLDAGIEGWRTERESFEPRAGLVELLAQARLRYGLTVAMGTWCGDSREQVPRLQRVLASLGDRSPFAAPVLVGGDRSKSYPPELYAFGPVELVPTIVVTLEGSEIGRIAEKPSSGSLEEDLATILAPFEGWEVPREE